MKPSTRLCHPDPRWRSCPTRLACTDSAMLASVSCISGARLISDVASARTGPNQRADWPGWVRRIARIEAVICQSEHEAAWLERNLLEQALPPWNKTAGGQEVPVFLRLDWQSGSPGVTVVHSIEPSICMRHFGPYLGGGKVRLAASALHRVMPLAYTGQLLHQSEQDMARVRGIDPNARLALVEAITSVLDRTPDAVTAVVAQLVRRRDAAAQNLDFERASRVQAEIQGFEWVVSEQNVTLSEPQDFDVCGWSHGILVQFGYRAGRLRSWTQRPCTQPDAQPYLAGTPRQWLQFAERNALFAAQATCSASSGRVSAAPSTSSL